MPGRSRITADAGARAALRLLARSSHRAEADRARAILLTLEGGRAAAIAAALGVHVSTVRAWRGRFAQGGVAALKRRKPPGRPSRVGTAAAALAAAILRQDEQHDGGWTRPRLRVEIERRGGPAIPDGRLAALRRRAMTGAIELLFLDEPAARAHPCLAHCWAGRGTGPAHRGSGLGQAARHAQHLRSAPRRASRACQRKRSTDLVRLLDELDAAHDGAARTRPLVIVLDDGPIHASKLTGKALAARPWRTVEWLPKDAPELNAIERCWRDLKRHHLANRTFVAADDLDRTIHRATNRLNQDRQNHPSASLLKAA